MTVAECIGRVKAAWVRQVLKGRIVFRDRYGVRLRLEATDDHALYFTHKGWFEIGEQEFCRRYLQADMTAMDIGAYIGLYTCLMALCVGPQGRVHAFEPCPGSYARLNGHLLLNGLTNVEAHCQAIFSNSQARPLFLYGPPFESLSSVVRPEVRREKGVLKPAGLATVETVSLDEYCTDRAQDALDLLKLDVEGAELEVLKGAEGLLRREKIGALLFEVGQGSTEVVEHLTSRDFELFAVSNDGSLVGTEAAALLYHSNGVAIHRSRLGRAEVKSLLQPCSLGRT